MEMSASPALPFGAQPTNLTNGPEIVNLLQNKILPSELRKLRIISCYDGRNKQNKIPKPPWTYLSWIISGTQQRYPFQNMPHDLLIHAHLGTDQTVTQFITMALTTF